MDKIYLQVYSVREVLKDAYRETLRKVAEMGYNGIEFAMGYGGMSVEEMKAFLAETGLDAIASHVALENIEADIPYLAALGVPYIICPMTSLESMEEVREKAAEFNRLGRLAKEAGIRFGYHNHTREFITFEGKTVEEWLMELTDPELVCFELDCGWATCAGVDVCDFIEKHSDRVELIHVKETNQVVGVQPLIDWSSFPKDENGRPIPPAEVIENMQATLRTNCPTCQGIIDWAKVERVAKANGAKAFIVEREYDYKGGDILGCVREDLEALKKL